MKDDPAQGCMFCGEPITDPDAPARFCSRACFDVLVKKAHEDWDQRYRATRAAATNETAEEVRVRKPLSVIMRARGRPALAVRPFSGDAA